ncbi:MAG: hypothetical protein JWN30_1354 [Bacilli bacterium]|nr:hypothetical protein [Bacilli bacterium]
MSKTNTFRNKMILSLGVSSVALGFMLATQYRLTQHANGQLSIGSTSSDVAELQKTLTNIQKKNQDLEGQVNQLDKNLVAQEASLGASSQDLLNLEKARIEAGTTAVIGDGVSFTVEDDPSLLQGGTLNLPQYVHEADVRMIIAELNLAGAEAIMVNGQRVTYASRIQCIGPTIIIDDHKSTVPFLFEAIGDKATLVKSLSIPNGVLDFLRTSRHLKISIVKEESKIKMPAYTGTFNNIQSQVNKSSAD